MVDWRFVICALSIVGIRIPRFLPTLCFLTLLFGVAGEAVIELGVVEIIVFLFVI